MIVSASRRTDIPAFYSDWFYNRIREGYALVRNPMNPHQVSRLSLDRGSVDCFVFWTKDPEKMLPGLNLIDGYPYYFQFTLNPYDKGLEPGVPKKARLIDTFKRLSEKIGSERVIWRYDPILFSDIIESAYHEKYFSLLAQRLQGYTSKCTISFIDYYRKIDKSFKKYEIRELAEDEKKSLAEKLYGIARSYGLMLETCAEEIDLSGLGIGHARCIDPELIARLTGRNVKPAKDTNQRKACGCAASVDIGAYNTCSHGCRYCYANHSENSTAENILCYDPVSPLLCSRLTPEDVITVRT